MPLCDIAYAEYSPLSGEIALRNGDGHVLATAPNLGLHDSRVLIGALSGDQRARPRPSAELHRLCAPSPTDNHAAATRRAALWFSDAAAGRQFTHSEL